MNTQTIIELVAGKSSRREIVFEHGIAIPLVLIGSTAPWSVTDSGLAPSHFALAYNGSKLFIGAAGKAPVYLSGSDISGRGWVEVPTGAMVEAGSARFLIHRRPQLHSSSVMPTLGRDASSTAVTRVSSVSTSAPTCVLPSTSHAVLDSGDVVAVLSGEVESVPPSVPTEVRRDDVRAMSSPTIREAGTQPCAPPQADAPPANRNQGPLTRSLKSPIAASIEMRQIEGPIGAPDSAQTRHRPLTLTHAQGQRTAALPPIAPPPHRFTMTAAMGRGAPIDGTRTQLMVASSTPANALMHAADGPNPLGTTRMRPPMLPRRPPPSPVRSAAPVALPPPAPPAPLAWPKQPAALTIPPPMAEAPKPGSDSGAWSSSLDVTPAPATTTSRNEPTERIRRPAPGLRGWIQRLDLERKWRSTSQVKKVTYALLAPTILLVALSGRAPSASTAPRTKAAKPVVTTVAATKPAPSPSATAIESAATAASPVANPAAAPAAPSAPSSSPKATSKERTAERRALDAAAAGDYAAAAEQYAALAHEHPDNPTYAEAARIMRAKQKR